MSKNTINVEVDLGYYWACLSSKKLLSDERVRIRSKVEFTEDVIGNTGDTYKYQQDDLKAIVGEGARQHNIELDKTRDEAYRILTYTLIGKAINDREPTEINLVINYPLNIYNVKTKKSFEEYLRTPEFISIFLNKKQKTFMVKKCIVFPQCIPVAYANRSKFKNKIKGIVDIGGLTAQGAILDNFNLVPDTKWTENLGGLILYNEIRKALNNEFSVNIQDYEMPYIIKNGLNENREKSKQIINNVINAHISQIIRHMKINNWNVDNMDIVFTGGGSLAIQEQLLNRFKFAEMSNDPLWDNTIGLRVVSDYVC